MWHDLVGYFGGLGTLKNFPYKLIVTASSLYATLAYKKFHRNILLWDSRENLSSKTMRRKSRNKYMRKCLNYKSNTCSQLAIPT